MSFNEISALLKSENAYDIKNSKQSLASSKVKPSYLLSYREPNPYDDLTTRISASLAVDNALTNKAQQAARASRKPINKVLKPFSNIEQGLFEDYITNKYDRSFAKPKNALVAPSFEVELEPLPPAIEESEKDRFNKDVEVDKQRIFDNIRKNESDLIKFKKEEETIKNYINKGKIGDKKEQRYLGLLKQNALKQQEAADNIKRGEAEYQRLDVFKIQALNRADEEQALRSKVQKDNLTKIEVYRQELAALNGNIFDTSKLPSETEEEYLKRLRDVIETEEPEDILEDSKALTNKTFKEKMRELIRDPVKIENVSNYLDDFQEVDVKAQILTYWETIKNKFLSIYGVDNKRVSAYDISKFFKVFLKKEEQGLLPEEVEREILSSSSSFQVGNISVDPRPEQDVLIIVNNANKKPLFLKYVIESLGQVATKYYLLYSFNGEKGSFKQYLNSVIPILREKKRSDTEIFEKTTINSQELNKVFDINSPTINIEKICEKMKKKYGINPIKYENPSVRKENYQTTPSGPKKHHEVGYGIEKDDIPNYAPFGKLFILLRKLFYHNQLSVKNPQMKSINGFPTMKVSERFVKLIMDMLKGIHPTHSDLSHLPIGERQIYDRMIILANLNKTIPHQSDKTVQELKKRLKLLEAEIEIGNNSPIIKKEIFQILQSLKDFKVINKKQVDDYLKQF